MARPNIPKFGNWENEDNVPYTVYFERARKGKTGTKITSDLNELQENGETSQDRAPRAPRSRPESPVVRPMVQPTNESTAAPNEHSNRRASGGSNHQRGGQGPARANRPDHSFDRSPLHPHIQAKVAVKGGGSPAWEGKNSYDSSHGTPGRSRMKPARGDGTPDRGVAVPRFGEWDENNSSSGNNYTGIFDKVREERVNGSPMVPIASPRPNYNIPRKQKVNDKKCGCFPWIK